MDIGVRFLIEKSLIRKNCTLTFMYYYSTSETIQRIELSFFGTRIFYATTKIFYKSRFQFLSKLVGVLLSHKCICSIHLREWEEGRKKESEMRVERERERERERDDHKWTSKGGLELKPLWLLQTSFILLHGQVQYKEGHRELQWAKKIWGDPLFC